MKIALVATHAHPLALGLRYISSYLKAAGHDVEMLFMSSKRDTAAPDWSEAALTDFIERVRSVDVVGFSLLTNTFHRASALVERIRQAGIATPIVWGGTHPTVAPEECLAIADVVCVGEGEEPMLQFVERLAAGTDPTDVPNLWFRAGGLFGNREAMRNPPGDLETQLDDLPFPDYELDTHWVADRAGLVPARPENLRGALHTLRVLTTRGCPYHCTFCNNTALRNRFDECGTWVRMRSLDNVLDEVRRAVAAFPTIEAINFVDDLFFVRKGEQIAEFAAQYKSEIGIPLELDAFPNTVTEERVRAVAKLPLQLVSMGIESACDDTLEHIYQRPTKTKRIAEAIGTLARHRIPAEHHYIVSNPFEPDENVIATMRFIADHHRRCKVLRVFPLMFYPGTPLYDRARREGLIGDQDQATYDYMGSGTLQFAKHDYLAVWLRLVLNLRNIGVPPWVAHRIIDFAAARPTRWLLDRRWFCPTVFAGYFVARKLFRNLIHQPFIRPWQRRRRRKTDWPAGRWELPRVNRAAMRRRVRKVASVDASEVPEAPRVDRGQVTPDWETAR